MIYIKLILFSVLLAAGQILFKRAALSMTSSDILNNYLLNHWLYFALILYGGATLLWVKILQNTPLSIAYPFAALGFVFVPAASYFLFKEEISGFYILGICLIIAGIALTNLK